MQQTLEFNYEINYDKFNDYLYERYLDIELDGGLIDYNKIFNECYDVLKNKFHNFHDLIQDYYKNQLIIDINENESLNFNINFKINKETIKNWINCYGMYYEELSDIDLTECENHLFDLIYNQLIPFEFKGQRLPEEILPCKDLFISIWNGGCYPEGIYIEYNIRYPKDELEDIIREYGHKPHSHKTNIEEYCITLIKQNNDKDDLLNIVCETHYKDHTMKDTYTYYDYPEEEWKDYIINYLGHLNNFYIDKSIEIEDKNIYKCFKCGHILDIKQL